MGEGELDVVIEYKYLGVWFTPLRVPLPQRVRRCEDRAARAGAAFRTILLRVEKDSSELEMLACQFFGWQLAFRFGNTSKTDGSWKLACHKWQLARSQW